MANPAWRIARSGKAHAFFGVRGAPACCGRVRIDDTRLAKVGEIVDVCLVCIKRLAWYERIVCTLPRAGVNMTGNN